MPRLSSPFTPARAGAALALIAGFVLAIVPPIAPAAGEKQLQRVSGTIGYQPTSDAASFKAVFGKFDLPDDDYAVTHGQSAAVLEMPDSSLISLGANTTVQVGAFDSASASPGSTITINGGAMRFDIRRPQGGVANYRFVTPTSQTAVRGTIGLISFVNGVTTVGCVVCAADSIAVTVGTQTVALVAGQFLTVSALGVITTGVLSSAVVGSFTAAGVPVSSAAGAAAAGIPAAAAAGAAGAAAGAASTAAIAGAAGAAAVGAAVGVSVSHATSAPSTSASSPAIGIGGPNAQPTGQSGNVNLNGHPAPVTTGAPRAPLAAPFPAAPGPAAPRSGR